jgi:hypothetical protein
MRMRELAIEYRAGEAKLRSRMTVIESKLDGADLEEKMQLLERLQRLETMRRETADTAAFLEHYYDRGYRRNRRFTI